jgi:hypothetical protein
MHISRMRGGFSIGPIARARAGDSSILRGTECESGYRLKCRTGSSCTEHKLTDLALARGF